MTKIVLFSDIHIHNYKAHSSDGSRLKICTDILKQIYEGAEERSVDTLVFGGDLFDTHGLIASPVVNAVISSYIDLSFRYGSKKTFAISGNHDYAKKNFYGKKTETSLTHLADIFHNFFRIIDNYYAELPGGDKVIGIPYYEYAEDYSKALDDAVALAKKLSGRKILVIHQTPDMGAGSVIPHDTSPHDDRYNVFQDVFCGHIHKRQYLTNKFTIIGNPLHRDLGDAGDEKGYIVYDFETGEKEFVSLKGKYPEFRKVRLSLGEDLPDDGYNYYEPVYIDTLIKEGVGVSKETFDHTLSPEGLLRSYVDHIKTTQGWKDDTMLDIGLECILKSSVTNE